MELPLGYFWATFLGMAVPSIAIFVKHSTDCKDRFEGGNWRRCRCRKYLRWFHDGKQHRLATKTRSWEMAEDARRDLERKFEAGGAPTERPEDTRKTIERAVELYLTTKRTDNVGDSVYGKLERELGRFKDFMSGKSKFFPAEVDLESLTEYRATWLERYPSSATRAQVQTRLRGFLRYCHEAGWLARVPKMGKIQVDVAPTMPLSEAEYKSFLDTIGKEFPETAKAAKVRALVQLMRHSGLAIRDAVTITRAELRYDQKSGILRILTSRQKTGTNVYVPIKPDVAKEIMAVVNCNHPFWSGNGLEQSAVTNWQHDLRSVFRGAFGRDTNFTPHCLRDTAACEWLIAGIPMEEVSKLLGHGSIKITEKHYSPWAKARQDRADSLVMATWGTK